MLCVVVVVGRIALMFSENEDEAAHVAAATSIGR
jgi:hypothetical protein